MLVLFIFSWCKAVMHCLCHSPSHFPKRSIEMMQLNQSHFVSAIYLEERKLSCGRSGLAWWERLIKRFCSHSSCKTYLPGLVHLQSNFYTYRICIHPSTVLWKVGNNALINVPSNTLRVWTHHLSKNHRVKIEM